MSIFKSKRFFPSILIGIVLFWNMQAAFLFIFNPAPFVPSFQLDGIPGRVMVQGLGILFLMWNIPYFFAFWHPIKNRLSLIEANLMQFIGLAGETLLQFSLPASETALRTTAARFMTFDGVGLILLLLALWITWPAKAYSS